MKAGFAIPALAAALAAPVWAHHGFGRFDMNAEIIVSGTLTDIEFVNPHSYVNFDVTLADGSIGHMGCEMRAATVLRRSGWSPEMFVVGSHIEITGRPHRDDPTSCYVETIVIGEAPVLSRYEQLGEPAGEAQVRLPGTAAGKPDITGEWAQEQYLLATLPDGSSAGLVPASLVAVIESGSLDPAHLPGNGWSEGPVSLTPEGEAAAAVLRSEPPGSHPRIRCEITSILFDWVFDGPINRISARDGLIVLEYGRDLVREVHLDQNVPADMAPSRGGYSVGHWEDDTLVVESTAFLPGRLVGNLPHSDQLRVTEHYTLVRDSLGSLALQRDYLAEDPLYFSSSYTGSDTLLPADAPFIIDPCKELAFEFTEGAGQD